MVNRDKTLTILKDYKNNNLNKFKIIELQKLLFSSIDIVRIRDRIKPYLKNKIKKEAIYV